MALPGAAETPARAAGEPSALPPIVSFGVPSGANLISSPVDAGSGSAPSAFLGLPRNWPLFYAWNAGTQSWVDGGKVQLRMGDGYWLYNPAPLVLSVAGAPYHPFKAFHRKFSPGWHLIGVPFVEGFEWKDVRLFASGNPIGLESAFDLGWIDSSILTMQGSEMEIHTPKSGFVPGRGYWLHVNSPVTLRAERAAPKGGQITPRSAGPGLHGSSTAQTMGWIVVASESVTSMTALGTALKTGKDIADASFSFLGATFALAKFGLEASTNQIMDRLNEMDSKLDSLITTVDAMEGQLTFVETEIEQLQSFITSEEKLGVPMRNAEDWLTVHYKDQTSFLRSRNWARYALAGCDIGSSVCDETQNPVTQADYDTFNSQYVKNPGKTSAATDDFYLWWSYSVVGGMSGVSPFISDGLSADGHYQKIQTGLTADAGTSTNGLVSYMQYVLSKSPCALDVSPDVCDLYAQVYVPLEAYFQNAIGDQLELVQANVEASTTIAQVDPGYKNAVDTYMVGVRRNLSLASEAFLQTVELLALYRAADGISDWNTFGASDAGQALARADFLVQQLSGQDYQNPLPPGHTNPPWPAQGVVGRIFYTVNEPAASSARNICPAGSPGCSPAVAQISDVGSSAWTVQGDWPYLQYQVASGAILVEAIPARQWRIKRLAPATLSTGSYQVASSNPTRGGASLVVSTYDRAYQNPPQDNDPANQVVFASFNGLEGPVGQYGLNNAVIKIWKKSGGDESLYHEWNASITPAGFKIDVGYTANTVSRSAEGFWGAEASLFFAKDTETWSQWSKVRFSWPVTDVDYQLDYYLESQNGGCSCCLYNNLHARLEIVDSDNNTVTPIKKNYPRCDGSSSGVTQFNDCSFTCRGEDCDWSLRSEPLILKQGSSSVYTLRTGFTDKIQPSSYSSAYCYYNYQPDSDGYANTHIAYPMITITK